MAHNLGKHLVALQGYDPREVLGKGYGVDAEATCEVEKLTSRYIFTPCALLARRLLEGTRRYDAPRIV